MFKENQLFSQADIEENKVIAALCNVPILFWLAFVAAPNSPYAKYNANHGLIFLLAGFAAGILMVIPIVGFVIYSLLSLAISVSVILGIVFAATGKSYDIPGLDSLKLIK